MDDVRDALRGLRQEQDTYLDRRRQAVDRARSEGLTWREIAELLGMTQHGLIKAHQPKS